MKPRSETSRRRTIKLECTGCGRRFRLKPVEGKPLPDEVDCPRCGASIEVPREDLGWEKREISRVFGRESVERQRPETGGHAPTPEKKSRVFRDVTQVNPTPVSRSGQSQPVEPSTSPGVAAPPTGDDQSNEPSDEQPSLGARLRKLKGKRLTAPSLGDEDSASDSAITPEDALDTDFDAIVNEAASAVDEVSEVEEAGDDAAEEPVDVAPTTPPPTPVAALGEETENENDNQTENENDSAPPALEPPYTVRVDNEVHEELGLDAVAELVRSGIWTEVVEIQTFDGEWIRLSNSSVMNELRAHLAEQAKSTLKLVATGEWERENRDSEEQSPPPENQPRPSAASDRPDQEQRSDEAPEPDGLSSSTGAGTKVLLGMFAVFAIAAIVGIYQWQRTRPASPSPAEANQTAPKPDDDAPAEAENTTTLPTDPYQAAQATVYEASDPARAANALTEAGHYKAARHLAIDTWATNREVPGLQEAFDRAVEDDPALHPEVATLGEDVEIDRVFALGGGRSISFRLTNDGETLYAFKPEQKEWGRGWRAELAAYLFCEVVVCQFEVPKNRPVRISRERFEKLYGLVETYRQTRYAERFEDLRWHEERGPDGREREYLYGVLEEWVPGFVDWPIEYTSIWENWLDVRYHPGVLDEPLVEELAPLQQKENSSAYSEILSERGGATTRDIARQLSSMLLFDFLTSNWDRFSDVEAYYGVNNQFADGRFISLDLGAAFFDERINKVASRFDLVTRFSARTVASIRALSPETINPVLFPDPTSKEKYRLALFWTQHDEAVQRIDALIEKYGRERVLEFR